VDPERRLSYRWHPYAVDASVDYSAEPTTLVTFTLEDAGGGTLLTIVESGFDQVPLHRRAEAMRSNDSGWTEQIKNIERHVSASRPRSHFHALGRGAGAAAGDGGGVRRAAALTPASRRDMMRAVPPCTVF